MHISHRLARATIVAGALIATGAVAVPALAAPAGKTRTVVCRGSDRGCNAIVNVAGGASNVKLRVQLPGTNLKFTSVVAHPSFIHGAYNLSGGRYSLGGSLYTVTLNAVQSIPKGSTLTLRFTVPTQALACKATNREVSFESIARTSSRPARGAFTCQQANAVTDTWALRFNAHMQVEKFSVNDLSYRCRLVPSLPQNLQCDGGGTRIKFSGPTGG